MDINPGTGKEYTQEELEIRAAKMAYKKAIDDELPDSEIERLMGIHSVLVKSYMDKREFARKTNNQDGGRKVKSFDEICNEHPEQADQARKALAHAHELNARLNELESRPNDTWVYKKAVKDARAEYDDFYKTEIRESRNPIIKELNAQ